MQKYREAVRGWLTMVAGYRQFGSEAIAERKIVRSQIMQSKEGNGFEDFQRFQNKKCQQRIDERKRNHDVEFGLFDEI